MNMVGHYYKLIQGISFPVKMTQAFDYNFRIFRTSQQALTASSINPLLHSDREKSGIFLPFIVRPRFRVFLHPMVSFAYPLVQLGNRQGIGKTECDKLWF
jgi:hypothetical protein